MNRSISIKDPDGDAVELSLTKEGVCVTATTHDTSPAAGDQLTVGPFELSNLRAALDGFAPVQESRHADALTFDQARSLIEERDQAVTDRDQAVEALDNTLGRAIRAERELNELRTQREADGARISPTTPTIPEWGDIPEDERKEMVERFQEAFEARFGFISGPENAEPILAAALTSPLTRPEWEKESAKVLTSAVWGMELPNEAGATGDAIAAELARRGYKVVRAPEVGQ